MYVCMYVCMWARGVKSHLGVGGFLVRGSQALHTLNPRSYHSSPDLRQGVQPKRFNGIRVLNFGFGVWALGFWVGFGFVTEAVGQGFLV